ncbi:hypothetical protein EV175_001153 [Coemansia sp. RSA 1933]|nr:hypothetical protein EV175_001153 [Coemansia sp. RSA 1933]
MAVPVLILGCGFVGRYLADLLANEGIDYVATTTDGRERTIRWRLPKPEEDVSIEFEALPAARSVVITFPLQGEDSAKQLVDGYTKHHSLAPTDCYWIYLGSTRPFKDSPSTYLTNIDIAAGGARVEAEEYLIKEHGGCVLNLAGLWGGARDPHKWSRFYTEKEKLCKRLSDRSLHLVHGADVARAIYVVISQPATSGGRWLISDKRVHDVLEIYIRDERIRGFVRELLEEEPEIRRILGSDTIDGIELDASAVTLRIDSSHFWNYFRIEPKYPFVAGMPDPY